MAVGFMSFKLSQGNWPGDLDNGDFCMWVPVYVIDKEKRIIMTSWEMSTCKE